MEWGTPGWLVIGGIVVLATLAMGPSSRAAERFLQRDSVPSTRDRPCLNPPVATRSQWFAGARPRTLPAAVAPVLAGTGVAAYVDGAVWWKAGLALVVSLALQVGVNYANDYSDGIRGTDDERVGPLRLVGSGVASPAAVKRAAFAAFGGGRPSPAWCWRRPPPGGWSRSGSSASSRRGSTPAASAPTATSGSAR